MHPGAFSNVLEQLLRDIHDPNKAYLWTWLRRTSLLPFSYVLGYRQVIKDPTALMKTTGFPTKLKPGWPNRS